MAFSPYDLPQNQRLLQRRRAQADAQNLAVPGAVEDEVIAKIVAEDEARKRWGAEMGMKKEQFSGRLGLGQQRQGLAEKRFEYGKENTANRMAFAKESFDKRLAAGQSEFDRNVGFERESMDTLKSQNKYATGIGVANLGVSGLGAYNDVQAAKVEAARIKGLESSYNDLAVAQQAQTKKIAEMFIKAMAAQK